MFHLGSGVPDLAAGENEAQNVGVVPLMRGRRIDGSGFTYFDTAERAGVVLEIRKGSDG